MATNEVVEGMPRDVLEAVIAKTPFAQLVGAVLTRYGGGEVELTVPLSPQITQHHGFVHGAIVGFMADSACAWAAASVAGDVVTAEYKLNLIAPATGSTLVGRGYVIKASGRQVICRADVFSVTGTAERMVATALATIMKFKLER
jgi:uncharacterized protein (TIGR00369 family)